MVLDPSKANEFFWRYHYGALPLEWTQEMMIQFGKAVLIIIGADGEIAPSELAHFVGVGRCLGAPQQMLDQLATFDVRNAKLEDCLQGFKDGVPARAMIYDAIAAASADGHYHPAERAAVAKAAHLLGIEPSVVATLEGLVEMETTLRKTRGALLSPDLKTR
jgi:uncharacterized tellurite resistance protein B-like protein